MFLGPILRAAGTALCRSSSSSEKPEFQVLCEDTELVLDLGEKAS